MATLALAAVGAAVGSTVLPAGISFLGATLTGAAIGSQFGALAGSYVDNALFGASGQSRAVEGPQFCLRIVPGRFKITCPFFCRDNVTLGCNCTHIGDDSLELRQVTKGG